MYLNVKAFYLGISRVADMNQKGNRGLEIFCQLEKNIFPEGEIIFS